MCMWATVTENSTRTLAGEVAIVCHHVLCLRTVYSVLRHARETGFSCVSLNGARINKSHRPGRPGQRQSQQQGGFEQCIRTRALGTPRKHLSITTLVSLSSPEAQQQQTFPKFGGQASTQLRRRIVISHTHDSRGSQQAPLG